MRTEEHPAARLGIEDRMNAFHVALRGEDELGVIIRAHIYVEHELIEFIRARMSPPEAFDAIRLDYDGRVRLALALGLPGEFKAGLTFAGNLRNKFAHRLEMRITKQEADGFEAALGRGKAITKDAYRRTRAKLQSANMPVAFSDREPMDRVVLCFVTLWSGTAVAVARAKGFGGTGQEGGDGQGAGHRS